MLRSSTLVAAAAAIVFAGGVAHAAVVGISLVPPTGVDLQRLVDGQTYRFGLRLDGDTAGERLTGAYAFAEYDPGSTSTAVIQGISSALTADAFTVDLSTDPVVATLDFRFTGRGAGNFRENASDGANGISTTLGAYDLISPVVFTRVVAAPEPAGLAAAGLVVAAVARRRRRRGA